MQIDHSIGQRIAGAARALSIARAAMENAKGFEERKALQANFERAEREMIEASMLVNRGLNRVAPPP